MCQINKNEINDTLLLQRGRSSEQSFSLLFERYWQQPYAAENKRLKNHEDAIDTPQEIFMRTSDLSYLVRQVFEKSDRDSFDQLFRIFYPEMVSYAKSLVQDEAVAKDLVQDIFLNLWVRRDTLISLKNLPAYLYVSLKHNAVHHIKKDERKITLPDYENDTELFSFDLSDPERQVIQKENAEKIERAINSLPYKCRLVFRLIKEDGLRYKEVASLLDISIKTVEAHVAFAYTQIIDCLESIFSQETLLPFIPKARKKNKWTKGF